MMADEALLELIKATREDVVNLRDNHLAHMKEDIQEIKENVCDVSHRVSSIEDTITIMKTHWWKIATVVICGVFGVDMGADMLN